MSFTFVQALPTPAEIREAYPLPAAFAELKQKRDQEIKNVLAGKDPRFLLIIGPCSADISGCPRSSFSGAQGRTA